MRNSAILTLVMATLLLMGATAAEGQVLIGPRVGYYKPMDADDGNWYAGGALRVTLVPGLGAELAADYHSDDAMTDFLSVRTIPVTASAILNIFPAVYVAGGVGWYHTKYSFSASAESQGFEDRTNRDFGYQFGGGLVLGASESGRPQLVLDGRWHFLNEQKFKNDVQNLDFDKVDPDFWSANAALMFRFQ